MYLNKTSLIKQNINSGMVLIRKEELKMLYKQIKFFEEKLKNCQCNSTNFIYTCKVTKL